MSKDTRLTPRPTDGPTTLALIKVYTVLNDGGKHWIQGYLKKSVDGVTCRCLVGGVNYVAPKGKLTRQRREVLAALYTALPPEFRGVIRVLPRVTELDYIYEESCISFNDCGYREYDGMDDPTTWTDVKAVIAKAVTVSRRKEAATA